MMKHFTLTFFLLTIFQYTFSQVPYLDSLTKELNKSNIQTPEKIHLLRSIADRNRVERQYENAIKYCREYVDFSLKNDSIEDVARGYMYFGITESNQENFTAADSYIDSLKQLYSKKKVEVINLYTLYLQSYQYLAYSEYKKVADVSVKGLALLDNKYPQNFEMFYKFNYMLYMVYTEWNDLDNTYKYADKSIEYAQKSGNMSFLSNAYLAMGVAYTYKYNKSQKPEDLKGVFDFTEKPAILYNQYPGQVDRYTYAMSKINYASYILAYYPKPSAEQKKLIRSNIKEAMGATETQFGNQTLHASGYGMLANLARSEGDYKTAEKYLLDAQKLVLSRKPIYYHILISIAIDLSLTYKEQGDYVNALTYQEKATEYTNELFNENEASSVKKIEAEYQVKKKETENTLLKERAAAQRKEKFLYAGVGLIAIIGSFFMFRSYNYRLKYSLQREKKLAAEKKEAELDIKLHHEEQARLKAEQELLTMQQEKLQNEVMANQLHLQHKNDIIQQIKNKISNDSEVNIQQIVRGENILDSDFESTKFQLQSIHPNFFKSLHQKAQQKLTDLDLKYCAYIHIGMNTKQIANVINVEPKSVHMTKYRLKKKFGLDEATDLIRFIKEIV
ncbi:MAG: hypothetical protein DI598_12975 [Pseudopedobacter saltans]|uniref:HTH luxR-type domain-containing protein n=1 Tax=Pseudopedobacter saltans TaxID=151895 RepID=A0A2W5GUX5_9SPHI|nr:MAG: hypothetical protein DI598_12975 [Pseudopedobacter saltans]